MQNQPSEVIAAVQQLIHKARFTKKENTAVVYVLRGWFASLAGIPGSLQAGDDAWSFTTLDEHFDSGDPDDPAKETATQKKVLDILGKRAQAAQDALDKLLGAGNNEDERINAAVDVFVQQVIHEITGPAK